MTGHPIKDALIGVTCSCARCRRVDVVRLHPVPCMCESCQTFDRVDWSATLAREIGARR